MGKGKKIQTKNISFRIGVKEHEFFQLKAQQWDMSTSELGRWIIRSFWLAKGDDVRFKRLIRYKSGPFA